MLFVTGVTCECFSTQYFILGALTVLLPYGKHKRLSQLLLADLLVEKYHLETEHSVPPAPITPTPVAVIKLKSMILERWWEINMQTHASDWSQALGKKKGGGGCVLVLVGPIKSIRGTESTNLDPIPATIYIWVSWSTSDWLNYPLISCVFSFLKMPRFMHSSWWKCYLTRGAVWSLESVEQNTLFAFPRAWQVVSPATKPSNILCDPTLCWREGLLSGKLEFVKAMIYD